MNATSCEEVSDLFESFVDGELAGPEQEAVARHVRDCATCRRQVEGLRALQGTLREVPPYQAPPELGDRIKERLAEVESPGARRGWRISAAQVATHIAAAAIGLVAGYWLVLSASQFDGLSRELLGAHVRSLMATQPIDVASGDPHKVGPWFAGELDFAPKVRDFGAQGFPLVGGRVDYLDGRRVAALVYRRREHIINVFVVPHAGGDLTPARDFRRHGYNVESWSDGEYDFRAISDLNRRELGMLAALLGRT